MKHADVVNAVKRAIAAYELGQSMTPPGATVERPRAHDYPHKPVLDKRHGTYEYRAVVRGYGPTGAFETLVTMQTVLRQSGEEVVAEARRIFWEEVAQEQRYRRTIGALDSSIVPDVWIVSATRHQPDSRIR